MPEPLQAKRASDHLDFIRGLAAVAVLIYHVRYRFFLDYSDLTSRDWFSTIFYAITSFGHDAVMVFFVLSGYFISASVLRDQHSERWSWRKYAVNRLTRLYLVLLPGLFLTVFWDCLGLACYPTHPIYTGETRYWVHDYFNVSDRLSVQTFLGNAVFLQTILTTPLGSNDPLWSLSYEFWYYLLFPLLSLVFTHTHRWWKKIACLGLAGLLLMMLGKSIAIYFPIWLMGTLVSIVPQIPWLRRKHSSVATLLAGALFCGIVAFTHTWLFKSLASSSVVTADYVTAASFAVLLYFLLHNQTPTQRDRYGALAKSLSGFSYTLYVVHMPLLVFLRAAFNSDQPWSPDFLHVCFAGGLALMCLAYAHLIARWTEAKTEVVRRWLLVRLSPALPQKPTSMG